MGRCQIPVLAVALLSAGSLSAQVDVTPSYRTSQLECSQFVETSHTTITTRTGRRSREQTAGRRGVWRFRAQPEKSDLTLEGWLDTLVLWRRSPETTIRPDTDGLIGGRYRGVLTPVGRYTGRVQPFIPDEVAEIAGMATALDDFFPPLPPHPLHIGEVWTDSTGLRIQRLADSSLSGLPLYRFSLQMKQEANSAAIRHDTLPLELHQVSLERGRYVWHPTLGLLSRQRTIVVEITVPTGRTVQEPVRSHIEQQISVVRDLRVPVGGCGKLANPQTG
jgi:hypothetical protein